MISATIAGTVTRDSELRDAGGSQVLKFGVACNRKVKGEKQALFVDCSVWGSRGAALQQYVTKGTKVALSGELWTREHNGKTYLDLRVNEIELMGGGNREGGGGKPQQQSRGGGYDDHDYGGGGDDLPF